MKTHLALIMVWVAALAAYGRQCWLAKSNQKKSEESENAIIDRALRKIEAGRLHRREPWL